MRKDFNPHMRWDEQVSNITLMDTWPEGKRFRLCYLHRNGMGWDTCSEGASRCQVKAARAAYSKALPKILLAVAKDTFPGKIKVLCPCGRGPNPCMVTGIFNVVVNGPKGEYTYTVEELGNGSVAFDSIGENR